MGRLSLDVIEIASPCAADWRQMRGDDRVRHCDECGLNVFNLSALPRADAERLVFETEGRLCVRFYRRRDGTVLTRDCPRGWRGVVVRAGRLVAAVAAMVGLVATPGCRRGSYLKSGAIRPVNSAATTQPNNSGRPLMGRIASPPHSSTQPVEQFKPIER
ncbi:MAG: hypothetical protein U1A27_02835 [Phycisphaerae bacterium]